MSEKNDHQVLTEFEDKNIKDKKSESKRGKGFMKNEEFVSLPFFYGLKAGMTSVFTSDGNHIPVTVIKLIENYITQVKRDDKEGYKSYQIGFYQKREKLINKPIKGHLKKANVKPFLARFREVVFADVELSNLGKKLSYEEFKSGTVIDVTSVSKGKGFQGVIKKYNFSGGPASHGSHFHRIPGSIGNRATPGKVFKNKKMPGQMGNKLVTVQNLQIINMNKEKSYLLVKGSIPGAKNSFVRIKKAIKE